MSAMALWEGNLWLVAIRTRGAAERHGSGLLPRYLTTLGKIVVPPPSMTQMPGSGRHELELCCYLGFELKSLATDKASIEGVFESGCAMIAKDPDSSAQQPDLRNR